MFEPNNIKDLVSAAIYAYNKLTGLFPEDSYIVASILYLSGVEMDYFIDSYGVNSNSVMYYYYYRHDNIIKLLDSEKVKELGKKIYMKLRELLREVKGTIAINNDPFSPGNIIEIDRIILKRALRAFKESKRIS